MPFTPRSRPCLTPLKVRPRSLALAAGLVVAVSSRAGMRPVVLAQAPAPTLETGQVAEPNTYTTGPLFAGVGGSRTPLEQDLCEPSAKWLRLRFSELVLKGNDSLTLSGGEGGVFTFQGQHWENRSFFTRAFPGSCVHLSADLADPGSWFKVEALQFGTAVLAASPVVVAGAADICGSSCGATSDVILNIGPRSVFTAGDNAYDAGTLSEYNTKYDPTWGRFQSITRPTPGNHEYDTPGATGYFDYFNGVGVSTGPAGNRATGYYSYDVGDWHLIGLNSNLAVSTGSAQEKWLRADLAANTKPCTLAYWHYPRFSRGSHGSNASMQPVWQALYDFKADVVVNGHDHNYQRYAPQTPSGTADPTNGIREFVVGTGGDSHYSFTQSVANFEVGNTTAFGVLKLTLSSTGYSWNFLPIAGASFTDSGSGTCHKAGSAVPDFSLSLSPTSLTINRGSSGSSTVTVTSLNGFSSATTLSVRGLPSGVTAAFSANPVTPPSGGSARSTLTLTASSTATTGTSTLTVTGTSGGISHSAALTLSVSSSAQTLVNVRISSSSDDAEEQTSGTDLTSSDLELTVDGSVNQTVGLRFKGISIPRGAIIDTAYIQFKVDETSSTTTRLTIFGQAADNPPTFTSASLNVSSRPRTSTSVSWTPVAWTTVGAAGADQRTPNIASLVQAIVNRSGWASGNSQVFIITGDGAGKRTAVSYDGDPGGAPLLHVEYHVGSASNLAPSVNAGVDQTITLPSSATLAGTASDDGLPSGTLVTTWSKVSGPGTVTFGNANALSTTASFSAAGSYVLRLTASDGALSASDDIAITVNAAGQQTLSVVKRGAIHSDADASSYSFPSITAAANRLYVVFLSTSQGSVTAPSATRLSGAGLSFTEIGAAGGLLYSGSTGVRRIQAWRALVASGAGTGAIAISLNGTSTGMDAVLLEFAGVDTSGTNGSGALAQSTSKATSATSLTLSLAAFGTSRNRPVAFFNHRVTEATTPEGGYTELDDASHGSPAAGAECEWNASAPDTTPSASWATSSQAGGFALEVRAGFVP